MPCRNVIFFLIAAIVSAPAYSVVDFDAATPILPTYARETLSSGATTESSDGEQVFYTVANPATEADLRTVLGVGVSGGSPVYIRFQLSNAVFGPVNNVTLLVDGSNANVRLTSGGTAGDEFVVFTVSPASFLPSSAVVELQLDTLAISADATVSITYTAYETLTAAFFQLDFLYQNSVANYVRTVEGASPSITFRENTADVGSGFLAFTTASVGRRRANVGSLSYVANTESKSASTGNTVTLPEIVNEADSSVLLTGDFSFGRWYLDDSADCTSPDVDLSEPIADGDGTQVSIGLASFGSNSFNNLCVDVDDQTSEIQEDEYFVSSAPVPSNAMAIFDPATIDGNLGVIERNGTEVKLPSLTLFDEYQQRITIVNYRDFPVEYSLDFVAEPDLEITALEPSSGTVAPRQKLVLRVQDVVFISGGTRCAAILSARVREGSLGVSTTQINLADGSTDTVVYE